MAIVLAASEVKLTEAHFTGGAAAPVEEPPVEKPVTPAPQREEPAKPFDPPATEPPRFRPLTPGTLPTLPIILPDDQPDKARPGCL